MRTRWAAVAAVVTLALAGCGGDDEPASPATPDPPAATTAGPPPEPTSAAASTAGPAPASGRPAVGTCVELRAASDGRYTVADAGTAVVERQGDRLVVGRVTPADGWTHEVTEREDDEVEIEFRRSGVEVDLEVEIDDGRVEVEVCTDDDD